MAAAHIPMVVPMAVAQNNNASSDGGGMYLYPVTGNVTINSTSFASNKAQVRVQHEACGGCESHAC